MFPEPLFFWGGPGTGELPIGNKSRANDLHPIDDFETCEKLLQPAANQANRGGSGPKSKLLLISARLRLFFGGQ